MSTIKIPIRTVYDVTNAPIGLSEFQIGEVIAIAQGGTSGNTVAEAKLNLSITDSNIRSLFSVSGGGTYSNTSGIITINSTDLTPYATTVNVALKANIIDLTTANVAELTNLYFTNARAYSNATQIGYATNSNVALKANVADLKTANVAELTNLYYTDVRVYANTSPLLALKANVADLKTANVAELTNLYYTDTRVQSNVNTFLSGTSTKTISGSVNITGNLNVTGNVTTFTSNTIELSDTIIYLATNNSGDVQDIGFVGNFTNPGYQHTGLVRDASDGTWKLFANVQTEPSNNTLDFTTATYSALRLGAITATTGTFTGNVTVGNVNSTGGTFSGLVNAVDIAATGNVTSPYFYSQSDINLKKDITPIENPIDIINLLDGFWFKWKNNDSQSIGLIAQYVEKILPMLVGTAPDGSKTVLYNGIIALLIEGMKAQQKQIDELKSKING
jgi:hypothetical protein